MHYNWNWAILLAASPEGGGSWLGYLLVGLAWSLATALCAWVIALALGALVGTLRTTPLEWVARLCAAYVEVFRNVPLLAPDFHEFAASGAEYGYEGTAEMVAAATSAGDGPISVTDMRGWLLADGLVMLKYTAENQGRRANRTSLWRRTDAGHWQMFHHQGTPTGR